MKNRVENTMTRRRLVIGAGAIAAAGLLVACGEDDDPGASAGSTGRGGGGAANTGAGGDPEIGPNGHFSEIQESNNGTPFLIPLEEIRAGGPPKDGIPSIDEPQFVGPADWDGQRLREDMFVLGVEVNGKRRAYPFQIMVWHELVNDTFDGVPVLASYCPLCGSAIAFVREIDAGDGLEPVEFGVSGKLYNSDLLMYDRKTDSYWSQLTGTAVVGEMTGSRLEIYPSELMTWEEWKKAYPDSEVLTRSTGHNRDYDQVPYSGYDESPSIWFPVTGTDDRLHEKTRITGVELSLTNFGAYPDDLVAEHGPINDDLRGEPLLVVANPNAGNNVVIFRRDLDEQILTFSASDGTLTDAETGTQWNYDGLAVSGELEGSQLEAVPTVKGFWFAWFAFHQQTELWLPEEA